MTATRRLFGPNRPLVGAITGIVFNVVILAFVSLNRWHVEWWAVLPGCLVGLWIGLTEVQAHRARRELGPEAGPTGTCQEILSATPKGRTVLLMKRVVRLTMYTAFGVMALCMVWLAFRNWIPATAATALLIAWESMLVAWCACGLVSSVVVLPAVRGRKTEGLEARSHA
jgi:hypothetical protein